MAKKTNRKGISSITKKTISDTSYSSDGEKIVWCFDMIDRSGRFAFDLENLDFRSTTISRESGKKRIECKKHGLKQC